MATCAPKATTWLISPPAFIWGHVLSSLCTRVRASLVLVSELLDLASWRDESRDKPAL